MDDLAITKLAMVYSMETDLPAKVVHDFCVLLCTTDRRTFDGLQIFKNDGARRAMWEACGGEPGWNTPGDIEKHQSALISRLKKANLLR